MTTITVGEDANGVVIAPRWMSPFLRGAQCWLLFDPPACKQHTWGPSSQCPLSMQPEVFGVEKGD